jgi:glycerol kinase
MDGPHFSPYEPAFRPRNFSGVIDTESLKTPGSGLDIAVGPGIVSLEDYVAASERHLRQTLGEPESLEVVHEEHPAEDIAEKTEEEHEWFVGSIDQGTTSSRFIIFNGEGALVTSHQIEFDNLYPQSGYVRFSST